jgi:hypothetical protein
MTKYHGIKWLCVYGILLCLAGAVFAQNTEEAAAEQTAAEYTAVSENAAAKQTPAAAGNGAAFASASASAFAVTGNLTSIYTLGNAAKDQVLPTGTGSGAYEAQKNGFYTQANMFVSFQPVSFLEGYFKLTATARPGSFYVPLSLEPYATSNFDVAFDSVYGKASVFDALGLSLPLSLSVKTGKFKAEAVNYQSISKFGLETILDVMETANTYNYEIEASVQPTGGFAVSAAFVGNYRFDEGIQRLYDDDGGVAAHGSPELDKYDSQLMAFLRLRNFELAGGPLNAELVYGKNVSDIYSGHSFGVDAGYRLPLVSDTLVIPLGLAVAWYEKNIDLLARNASTAMSGATYDFRNTLSGALAVGLRLSGGDVELGANVAGIFTRLEHIYRDPLSVVSVALDAECTYRNRYVLGAGVVAGTLADARWQTKSDINPALDGGGYDHTFALADNIGFEIYGGINTGKNSRLLVGFNQHKGLAMNYNLENKPEGQMKYKLAGSEAADALYESGGLYLKFTFSF